MTDPIPSEIVEGVDKGGARVVVASNGTTQLTLYDPEGQIYRRRAIKGIALKPPAEAMLPLINQFAGELLANLDMPAEQVISRILALAGMVPNVKQTKVEWCMAKLDDVNVYVDGANRVIVTKLDLQP